MSAGVWPKATRSCVRSWTRARSFMKKTTREWVRKAEADYRAARKLFQGKDRLHDQSCYFCQQSAEKYLKALLEELGVTIPRTHILKDLLALLAPHHPSLKPL